MSTTTIHIPYVNDPFHMTHTLQLVILESFSNNFIFQTESDNHVKII